MASDPTAYHQFVSKNYGGVDSSKNINQSIRMGGADNSSVYASSAENISRLLEGWMRSSPLQPNNTTASYLNGYADFEKLIPTDLNGEASSATAAVIQCYRPQKMEHEVPTTHHHHHHDLEGILSFDHHHHHSLTTTAGMACDKSSCDSSQKGSESSGLVDQEKAKIDNNPPLSFLEKWLLDESAGQVEGVMELPPIF